MILIYFSRSRRLLASPSQTIIKNFRLLTFPIKFHENNRQSDHNLMSNLICLHRIPNITVIAVTQITIATESLRRNELHIDQCLPVKAHPEMVAKDINIARTIEVKTVSESTRKKNILVCQQTKNLDESNEIIFNFF